MDPRVFTKRGERISDRIEMKTTEDLRKAKRKNFVSAKVLELADILDGFNHEALPSIPFRLRCKLPEIPCVYVAYMGHDVYYVGQTVNLKNRWNGHHVSNKLSVAQNSAVNQDARIGWIELDKQLLTLVEKALIGLLLPILNVAENERYSTSNK